jgi:hypothetical protein
LSSAQNERLIFLQQAVEPLLFTIRQLSPTFASQEVVNLLVVFDGQCIPSDLPKLIIAEKSQSRELVGQLLWQSSQRRQSGGDRIE